METIKTHTNANGEIYYSTTAENGQTIYSFTEAFADIWTQEDQDERTPLCDLPDSEFQTGGRITDLCRAAGYDESGRVVVNNLRAWHMTTAEFAKTITGAEPHSA
jgi:hypothetical protein